MLEHVGARILSFLKGRPLTPIELIIEDSSQCNVQVEAVQ